MLFNILTFCPALELDGLMVGPRNREDGVGEQSETVKRVSYKTDFLGRYQGLTG